MTTLAAELTFELPPARIAAEPPEARGLRRDGVRLLVAGPHAVRSGRFTDLPDALRPGDLVVVNDSATLPAAVDAVRGGAAITVHFSTPVAGRVWVVELRTPAGPLLDGRVGETLRLPGGTALRLLSPHAGPRLWRAELSAGVEPFLAEHGRPIRYGYVPRRWPLADYQTVFARRPGSAEMPSAGRPFTADVVMRLVLRGVAVAPITLHTGVSSQEAHEPPYAERFEVPEATARLVNATRSGGGRVVAVGTTVARALETVAAPDGTVTPGSGQTELVLGPQRPARAVTGLVTGLHEPGASHLDLLQAVAGADLVRRAYDVAVAEDYLWHEFGDSMLLLP